MSPSDPTLWTTLIIAAALGIGIVRVVLWRQSVPVQARSSRARMTALITLQIAAGALLWLTMHPPASVLRTGTMIVATAASPASIPTSPGDILIALPEAGPIPGAERVPDLATALRRHPTPAHIRIEGQGLVPRDQSPLPVSAAFTAPPLPPGLIDVTPPPATAPGASFVVGGQVGTLTEGAVELVDPADTIVARTSVRAGDRFALTSAARAPGLALFDLRLRDASGALVERVAVPLETLTPTAPRVLVLAGAPGPETKFLQRWAEDTGVDLTMDAQLGGGVSLGGAPVALTASTLGALDLVVIDDRRWDGLSDGQKSALTSAVNTGLGLLLRPAGPLSPTTRRDWAALGLSVTGGGDAVGLRLDPPEKLEPVRDSEAEPADDLPELARRDLGVDSASTVTLLRDADGTALASWRARGRGRVGIWTVTDSYALVLTGRPDRYGDMWSALFSEIGRADDNSRPRVESLVRAGNRAVLCRLDGDARLVGQDGREHALRTDPASGDRACAAFWPEQAGWHVIRDGEGRQTPFYVHPADAASSQVQATNRAATLALIGTEVRGAASPSTSRAPGSPWPWFVALLVVLSSLWWLERNRTVGGLLASLRARLTRR